MSVRASLLFVLDHCIYRMYSVLEKHIHFLVGRRDLIGALQELQLQLAGGRGFNGIGASHKLSRAYIRCREDDHRIR